MTKTLNSKPTTGSGTVPETESDAILKRLINMEEIANAKGEEDKEKEVRNHQAAQEAKMLALSTLSQRLAEQNPISNEVEESDGKSILFIL